MRVTFLGAAGEVTGSSHLVEAGGRRVLLDCGMVQGGEDAEARNRAAFPFDPATLDAVVLSHAHIDHSGRLPLLVRAGFKGPIYTHPATIDLCRIMLEDSAGIHEYEAERENRDRAGTGAPPVTPLYTRADAAAVMGLFRPLDYGARAEIAPGVHARLRDAGHILGSALVELWAGAGAGEGRRKLLFSGDLGHKGGPLLPDPETVDEADLVVMESTYGDRNHRSWEATWAEMGEVLSQAEHHRGNVLIPAFAVGRSQGLMSAFQRHFMDWKLHRWDIYLDSPMAIAATSVYRRHLGLLIEAARHPAHGMRPFALPNLEFLRTPDESRVLNGVRHGAIVIAGSGMCTGGRILHHLRHHLWRPESHVMIVGFQPEGVPGRDLVDGAEAIRIRGERVAVRAQIHTIGGLSAHAGRDGLLEWYGAVRNRPPVALVHGEAGARDALARAIEQAHGVTPHRPMPGDRIEV